jgi:hypothetical protein
LIHMHTNTAFCAVPDLTIPVSCPSTTARHVSVSQGHHQVARHYCHTDHMVCIKFFLYYLHRATQSYCPQNLKTGKLKS